MGQRGPQKGRPELAFRTDPARQQVFLDALAETGSIIESARRCSPHSETGAVTTVRAWMRDSAEFSAKVQEALDTFRDSLVREAVRRGRDGVRGRPVHYKGEIIAYERQYSDNLLLAELKRHFPQHYSEKHQHEHKVQIQPSGAWVISTDDVAHLSADQRSQLASIMDSVRSGRGERLALENQPGEIIDVEAEVEDDPPAYWELAAEGNGDA